MKKLKIGMLIFPEITLLDFVGPYDVFIRAECFEIFVIAETIDLIKAEGGLQVKADYTLADSPALDIIFVPGGRGINNLLTNVNVLEFLKSAAQSVKFITSVCTGSLLLAAAGLLDGYKATTHWRSISLLKLFNVEVIDERIVIDRNRITGGGVTAGIDFGLILTAVVGGDNMAKLIELQLAYDPSPPFNGGSVKKADVMILGQALEKSKKIFEDRVNIINTLLLDNDHKA